MFDSGQQLAQCTELVSGEAVVVRLWQKGCDYGKRQLRIAKR